MKTSRIYHRGNLPLTPTTDRSEKYSRNFARKVFDRMPQIVTVEYVTTGNIVNSQFVGDRGVKVPPAGVYVRICSTGGKWGKSARDFYVPHSCFSAVSGEVVK